MRFTAYDPVTGKFEEPMTLHKYLYCGNEPVNKTDLSGKWWGYIHDQMMHAAFGDLYPKEMKFIKSGSAYMDKEYFGIEYSYMHGMRNGNINESVSHAAAEMENFTRQQMQIYEECMFEADAFGDKESEAEGYFHLGMVMHSVQDSINPLHEGFQPWYNQLYPEVRHGISEPESISNETLMRAVKLMYETIDNGGWVNSYK
jgi:hypothetical protein